MKINVERMDDAVKLQAIAEKALEDKLKEIQAANSVDIQKVKVQLEQVKQQEHSYKDEWLCIFFTILMGLHFWPPAQNAMDRGWDILQKADPMFFLSI